MCLQRIWLPGHSDAVLADVLRSLMQWKSTRSLAAESCSMQAQGTSQDHDLGI
jgi:hypothetical protein